jgi:hypothetical protein
MFAIETIFEEIKDNFASFDGEGNVVTEGIWDLNFSEFFGNVTKSDDDIYTANITLSYSYIPKTSEGDGEEVFNDFTASVGMTYDNKKWSVVSIENAIIS